MKKTGLFLAALCACALLISAAAAYATPDANVTGTWTITMAPPPAGSGGGGGNGGGNGGGGTPPPPPTVTFTQEGANVKGTQSGRGGDVAFTGSVSGNTVTWSMKRMMGRGDQQQEVTVVYKATVDGDKMTGTQTIADRPARDFTATRNK